MKTQLIENSISEFNQEIENSLEILEEEIKIDNIVIEIKNGYGACKSCNCKGWIPNYPKNDYCKNCGHHWTRHS